MTWALYGRSGTALYGTRKEWKHEEYNAKETRFGPEGSGMPEEFEASNGLVLSSLQCVNFWTQE